MKPEWNNSLVNGIYFSAGAGGAEEKPGLILLQFCIRGSLYHPPSSLYHPFSSPGSDKAALCEAAPAPPPPTLLSTRTLCTRYVAHCVHTMPCTQVILCAVRWLQCLLVTCSLWCLVCCVNRHCVQGAAECIGGQGHGGRNLLAGGGEGGDCGVEGGMRHFTFCQPHFCSLTNYFVKGANNVALASLSVRCAISFVRKWFQPFFGLLWSPNASDPRRIGSQSERSPLLGIHVECNFLATLVALHFTPVSE